MQVDVGENGREIDGKSIELSCLDAIYGLRRGASRPQLAIIHNNALL